MKCLPCLVFSALVISLQTQMSSQTARWESLDGPPLLETRVHLRYPDGDRLILGNMTGTYRTTDGGVTWVHLSSPPGPNFQVYHSSTGALIGICDTPITSYDKYYPGMMQEFVSTDRGEHWSRRCARTKTTVQIAFGTGDTVYQTDEFAYGTSSGKPVGALYIIRSTDAGLTWGDRILSYSGIYGFTDVRTQPGNVFVKEVPLGSSARWFRSIDGGSTWQIIQADQVMFHAPDNLLRTRRDLHNDSWSAKSYIEHSTDDGKTWNATLTGDSGLVSLVTNGLGTLLVLGKPGYELFRSTDAGRTWSSLGREPAGDPFTSVGFYGKTFAVGTTQNGVYCRSIDYGTTWSPILDMNGSPLRGTVQPATDSLFVVADATGRWLESTDAGGTWHPISHPYERAQIASLLASPSGSVLAGGVSTLSRKRRDELWSPVTPPWKPSGAWPQMTDTVWALSYGGGQLFHAATGKNGIEPRILEGSAYGLDTSEVSSGARWSVGGNSIWNYMYRGLNFRSVFSLTDRRVLAGSWNNIWSVEGSIGQGFSSTGFFTALARDSAGMLWAGNDSTGVFRSTDLGVSWIPSKAGLGSLNILSLAVARNGHLLAGTRADGVFRSTDGGATWASSGLSGRRVQALAGGPGGTVYAGLADGVCMSPNAGEPWTDISSGLSNTDIRALAVAPDGKVYCGTWGDGVYRLTESGLAVPASSLPAAYLLAQNYPNPCNPSTTIKYELPKSSIVRLSVFDMLGREVAMVVNERREAGVHEVKFDGSGLASGVYLYRLKAGDFVQSRKLLFLR